MKLFKSIKLQIIVTFLGITIFTGLIVSLISYWESKKFLDIQLDNELNNTGNLIKKNIEDKLSDVTELVLNMSNKPEVKKLDKKKIQSIIENFVEFSDVFFNVYIYDKDGYLISAAYSDKRSCVNYLGENFHNYNDSFSDYANQIFKDKTPRFSNIFHSKRKRLILAYIAPIIDGSAVNGIISCGIYVYDRKLQNILERLIPPYNGFNCLIDHEGNILGYGGTIPPNMSEIKIKDLLENKEEFKLGKEDFRYKLNKVGITHSYILVAAPKREALKLLTAYTYNIIFYNALSLILAICISIFIANLVTRPISLLVEGLKEVGNGNYTFRINFKSSGEFDSAIKAFNDMAEKLHKNRIIEKIWIENWK